MLIVRNIDPTLLAELLVEAARERSKAMSRRRMAAGQARDPASPDREPGRAGGGERTDHVRVAR